jgi:DNA-binding transcriptional regulator YiaG
MAIITDNIWGKMDWTAKKIREIRKTASMTQTQLAHWLGVTQVHVAHLESGFRPPGPQTMRLLQVLAERVKSGDLKAVQSKRKERRTR